ncbi:hypothetical protein [Salisaeta longa]|uniref:hypothetical protein n=1 Tax=Salisaeta longa TaxID=503170 RepID=UPI0003B7B4EB|nr:hypothetical protein [Salisaeta longa]
MLLRLGLLCLAGWLVGCGTARLTPAQQQAAYAAAIRDAKTAAFAEVTTQLTPITPAHAPLRWRTIDGARHVQVVTWTDTLAGRGLLRLQETVWVTPVPVLQQMCRAFDRTGPALADRLRQVLGLPPHAPYTRFVTLWVRPHDLVRPCPDPEINDRECLPNSPRPSSVLTVSSAHTQWMDATARASYHSDGYPWTRLGYTYDWHPGTDEVGVSEFVIHPGATVRIANRVSTARYCMP